MTATPETQLYLNATEKELDQETAYKYLGVSAGGGIQHPVMKQKIRKEFYQRVIKSEINAANKIKAINILVVPVVT